MGLCSLSFLLHFCQRLPQAMDLWLKAQTLLNSNTPSAPHQNSISIKILCSSFKSVPSVVFSHFLMTFFNPVTAIQGKHILATCTAFCKYLNLICTFKHAWTPPAWQQLGKMVRCCITSKYQALEWEKMKKMKHCLWNYMKSCESVEIIYNSCYCFLNEAFPQSVV